MRRARALVVALLAGVALSFAFPEPDVGPLAWVALVPLIVAAPEQPAARAFALGASFGIGFFGVLLVWISLIGWLAWLVLVSLQAAFVGVFALAWSLAARRGGRAWSVIVPALVWVALEFARAHIPLGGFTWGQLAQSQHDARWLLRLAAIGGGWLVTFVLVLVNGLLADAYQRLRRGRAVEALAAAPLVALLLAAPLALTPPRALGRPLRVAIVQGNVPRSFTGSVFDKQMRIIRSHERLTKKLAPERPDLVIWPESSVGLDFTLVPEVARAVRAAARAVNAPLVVGADLESGPGRYLVMALEVSPRGRVVDRYQKTHLVPFGEYVPLRPLLRWVPGTEQVPRDATAGSEPVVFDVAGGRVAPVISFEGDFGSLVRTRIAAGGRLLVVATNTSTWGRSWASAQHVAFSQLRAAENGLWVAHAALSGISAFITPGGEVVAATPLWRATSIVHTVRFARSISFYARTGDWLPLLCLAASAAAVIAGARRARRVT